MVKQVFIGNKTTYRYELLHSKNIKGEAIDSTATLVRYVIGVNNDLIKKEEEGWLYVEKIKEGKQEDQILYGKRIDLPILEDNPYFHDLLDPFDTKKVISFVELLPSAVENQVKPEEKIKEPQDIVELEKNNKTTITTEEKENTELKEQPDEMADKETQKKILEQKIQFKKDELATLTEEIATKQEEINDLEQKLSTFSKKPEGLYL